MKTIKIFFLVSLFLFSIFSCEKDGVPKVIYSPIWTEVTAPASILYGEDAVIRWKTLRVKYIIINGKEIHEINSVKSGIFFMNNLKEDTKYKIVFKGFNNDEVVKSGTIFVDEPIVVVPTKLDTMINLICLAPWKNTKEEIQKQESWNLLNISDLQKRVLWTFTKDGKFQIYDPQEDKYIVSGVGANWYIIENLDSLFYGGRTDNIVVLDSTELILEYWIDSLNIQTNEWVNAFRGRITYSH